MRTTTKTIPGVPALAVLLLLTTQAQSASLLVNGDFEQGNTGFSSGHTYSPGIQDPNGGSGEYTITTNPTLWNLDQAVASYGDHTTGSGLMMAINGATSVMSAWGETVAVVPSTTYQFSGWLSDWGWILPSGTQQLDINGRVFGTLHASDEP